MILVESLLYKLDQRLNKLSTNEHQQIPVEDKILIANKAQNQIILQRIDTEDARNLGLDSFLKRYQDLEVIIESWKPISLSKSEVVDKLYTGDFSKLPSELMFYIDSYIMADKGECKDHPVNTTLVKHGDVTTLIKNNHYKPSFEYQDTLVTISAGDLEVYTDGTFTPTKSFVSYVRYPKEIDIAGYTKLDGTASVDQNSELPQYLEDDLVEIAAQMIMISLMPPNTK